MLNAPPAASAPPAAFAPDPPAFAPPNDEAPPLEAFFALEAGLAVTPPVAESSPPVAVWPPTDIEPGAVVDLVFVVPPVSSVAELARELLDEPPDALDGVVVNEPPTLELSGEAFSSPPQARIAELKSPERNKIEWLNFMATSARTVPRFRVLAEPGTPRRVLSDRRASRSRFGQCRAPTATVQNRWPFFP